MAPAGREWQRGVNRPHGPRNPGRSPASHRLLSCPCLYLQGTRKHNPNCRGLRSWDTSFFKDLGHKRSRYSRENCVLNWVLKSKFSAPNVQGYSQLTKAPQRTLLCGEESVQLESDFTEFLKAPLTNTALPGAPQAVTPLQASPPPSCLAPALCVYSAHLLTLSWLAPPQTPPELRYSCPR